MALGALLAAETAETEGEGRAEESGCEGEEEDENEGAIEGGAMCKSERGSHKEEDGGVEEGDAEEVSEEEEEESWGGVLLHPDEARLEVGEGVRVEHLERHPGEPDDQEHEQQSAAPPTAASLISDPAVNLACFGLVRGGTRNRLGRAEGVG